MCMVETGEGRTPRPENIDPKYTTSLANQLNSLQYHLISGIGRKASQ